jgi:hypothetical protein
MTGALVAAAHKRMTMSKDTSHMLFSVQGGSSLSASGNNYGMLRQHAALKRLQDIERMLTVR